MVGAEGTLEIRVLGLRQNGSQQVYCYGNCERGLHRRLHDAEGVGGRSSRRKRPRRSSVSRPGQANRCRSTGRSFGAAATGCRCL
jgi:hypothetical protein